MRLFLFNAIKFSLPLILLWVVFVPFANYYFDPYGLLSKPHHDYKTEPNLRSLKREIVSSPQAQFSLLLFSNSKGGVYQIPRDNFYNMSYSMGMPDEFLEDIIYIQEKGKKLDSVILFIDEYSIYNNSEEHKNEPLRKIYNLQDHFSILTIPFSRKKINSILSSSEEKYVQFYLDTDGHYEYNGFKNLSESIDTLIINNIDEIDVDVKSAEKSWLKLTSYLETFGIHYSLFIHPISGAKSTNFKRKFQDLSYLVNSLKSNGIKFENDVVILNDNHSCFYDYSHYSPKLARNVLESGKLKKIDRGFKSFNFLESD